MLAETRAQSTAEYRSSHRKQLIDISELTGDALDGPLKSPLGPSGGILFPVSRKLSGDLPGLRLAVDLALSHQCRLVVICSQEADVSDFPITFSDKLEDMLTLVDLADVHQDWLAKLESANHRLSKLERFNDVGPKRNVGLALAAFLGWQYILFVDDDIDDGAQGAATLDAAYLSQAIAALQRDSRLMAVGWTLEDYDDNSVVGHARSLLGLPQEIFIGAGALLVRCQARLPFFPDIYNEDWLFLIALAVTAPDPHQALGWCGSVRQRRYDPFQAERAKSEEVGEVIGEGLMNLLEDHGTGCFDRAMAPGFWRRTLLGRTELLDLIRSAAWGRSESEYAARSMNENVRRRLIESMSAALTVLRLIRAVDVVAYIRTWRHDQKIWESHLVNLAMTPDTLFSKAQQGVALNQSPAQQGRIRTRT